MLIGNDLIGAVNEILLGKISIEDIETIYTTQDLMDFSVATWADLDNETKINEIHFVEIQYKRISDEIMRKKIWEIKHYPTDNLQIYKDKIAEISNKLLETGKISELNKNNLSELPTLEVETDKYLDRPDGWAKSPIEFCVKHLVHATDLDKNETYEGIANKLKDYFPQYEKILDEMCLLMEDLDEYINNFSSDNDILDKLEKRFESKNINIDEIQGFYYQNDPTKEELVNKMFEKVLENSNEKSSHNPEMKKFYWQDKLELFKDVYCSEKISEELRKYVKETGRVDTFRPMKTIERYSELFAPDLDNPNAGGNAYNHLNGRNLLGIKRKWIEDKKDGKIKSGIVLDSGEITIDHSALTYGFLSNIFLEAHSEEELIDIVKELLDLSNEEIVRRFNITGSKSDMANLFNAIVLDPVIEHEVERENFKRYGTCWADTHRISLVTKDEENRRYQVKSVSDVDYYVEYPMEIEFPNGESIIFKQNFKDDKGKYSSNYVLDDISVEILQVKGDSEILKKVINQLSRFEQKEKREVSEAEVGELAMEVTYGNVINAEDAVTNPKDEHVIENDIKSHDEE